MADETFTRVVTTVKANPLITAAVTTAAVGIAWTVNDFREWTSFGTGGTPPTWAGYWRMTKLRVAAVFRGDNLLDTSPYGDEGPHYLQGALPRRASPRPRLMPRILPQRQVPDSARRAPQAPASRAAVAGLVAGLAARRPDAFEVRPSHTEGQTTDGLYARRDLATLNPVARDAVLDHEIGHAHPADGSLHVWLSDRDAREVIEKGWGQRFCLPFVNRGWVMVYAPRDPEGVKAIESIMRAAASYICGQEI